MEELTIEQKAQRYDEALVWMQDLYPTMEGAMKEDAKHYFPQLKENKSEKIRKMLVRFFSNEAEYNGSTYGIPDKDILDWLEKQEHTDNIIEKAKTGKQRIIITETDGRADIDWDTRSLEDVKKLLECGLQYINTELEKQNKQNHANSTKTCKIEHKFRIGDEIKTAKEEPLIVTKIDEEGYWSEDLFICSFDEEYLWDKVEPKFHKGEWIIFNEHHNSIYQVEKIDNYRYYLRHYLRGTLSIRFDTELIRKWTIKDAKAGDVLCWDDSKCIALFKNIYDNESFNSYGFVGHCTGIFEPRRSYHNIEGAHPATKEQRYFLFTKIREAGYKWDEEKLELKKVENEIEIPFGAKDSELQEVTYYIPKGFHAEIDDDNVVIKKGEKPTAWSEEEEETEKELIDFCIKCSQGHTVVNSQDDFTRWATWLKALKERVACEASCTTTKEWSKEDEIWIDMACMLLDELNHWSTLTLAKIPSNVNDIISHLKSIKERYTWKPSDEQMDALRYVTNFDYGGHKATLVSLYEQLKKLKG